MRSTAHTAKSSHNDALDGLRLIAVLAVMAFHFGLPHAAAGFLGVDVFFVLSGYLITSLLLTQLEGGHVKVLDFWARRMRRLIPALLVLIGVVVAWGAVMAPSFSRDGLRSDVTATLFYVANWHFISTSTYFANDGVASPLQHMWSLAVEEQFYLVWPLLLLVTGLIVRQPRRRLIAVGALAGAGVVASAIRLGFLWGSAGQDRAYLGTDSRIFEPLTGALLAVLMTSGSVRALITRTHWRLLALGGIGLVWALATLGGASGATSGYARRRCGRRRGERGGHHRRDLHTRQRGHPGAGTACRGLPGTTVVRHVPVALALAGVDRTLRLVGFEPAGRACPSVGPNCPDRSAGGALLPPRRDADPVRLRRTLPRSAPHVRVRAAHARRLVPDQQQSRPAARGCGHRTGHANDRACRRFGSATPFPLPGEGRCSPRLCRDLRHSGKLSGNRCRRCRPLPGSPGAPV